MHVHRTSLVASCVATPRARRVVGGLMIALLVAGCSSAGSTSGPSVKPAGTETAKAANQPVVSLAGGSAPVSFLDPVRLVVADGTLTSVQVSGPSADQPLDGAVAGDGSSWTSSSAPKPALTYQAVATVKDKAGQVLTRTLQFTVSKVPDSQRVSFTVTPNDGDTVGLGQPIVVRFAASVTERAAVEKAMKVDASTSAGQPVTGRWHWLSGLEVHWRPQAFWTPGTKVKLDMQIAGVKAASSRYGRKDYSQTFTIGASHITHVDARSHLLKVYRDGKLVDTWASGTGRPGLETYSGTYVVLGKLPVVNMDSCSARITCDKKNPDYYSEKEYWATRLTNSGTFVHAASWDGLLGKANVSHGCIHLADANAKDFFTHAVPGDLVIVSNTGRGPQERIATQDPGLYDWNLSWSQWVAGSALK